MRLFVNVSLERLTTGTFVLSRFNRGRRRRRKNIQILLVGEISTGSSFVLISKNPQKQNGKSIISGHDERAKSTTNHNVATD